jgi:hypothetical protein
MTIQFAEIIDRIWITVPLEKHQLIECHVQLWNQIKQKQGKPKQVKGGWRGTFNFGGDVSVGITVAKRYGHRYLQYDLQPTELDAPAVEQFLHLTSPFPGATYTDALTHGRVSKLEVAIDFLFKDTADLLIHKPGVHTSYRFFPPLGMPASVYAGAVKSTSISVAYNKTKPSILGGHTMNAKRARVERRVRYLGLRPVELGGLKNLFADLGIFSISAAESLTNHQLMAWPSFLQKAKVFGVASALAKFPVHRKQLLGLLSQCRVPWWKPATYMAQWDQTVAEQLRLSTVTGSSSGA